MRLWVEILLAARVIRWLPCQPLREAVSWNIPRRIKKMSLCSSASSWGCELKCYNFCRKTSVRGQPLREAVSWNTIISQIVTGMICQPLREAVSWNEEYNKQRKEQSIVSLFVRLWVEMAWIMSIFLCVSCQPLREAVSWNATILRISVSLYVSLFVRLWVEMCISGIQSNTPCVSLFVRLWVEIMAVRYSRDTGLVSLFVRLWVEMHWLRWSPRMLLRQPLREAVSWNNPGSSVFGRTCCQPLREAVSWNGLQFRTPYRNQEVSLFVRLWVEILLAARVIRWLPCQPLREAVSWNVNHPGQIIHERRQPLREAVSWNAFLLLSSTGFWSVSLFVRLWVEIKLVYLIWMEQLRQPLREAVSWNNVDETWLRTGDVSLFVRLWVEMLIAIIFTSSGFVSLFVRLWVEILEIQLFESESNVSLFVRLWVEITMGC